MPKIHWTWLCFLPQIINIILPKLKYMESVKLNAISNACRWCIVTVVVLFHLQRRQSRVHLSTHNGSKMHKIIPWWEESGPLSSSVFLDHPAGQLLSSLFHSPLTFYFSLFPFYFSLCFTFYFHTFPQAVCTCSLYLSSFHGWWTH